MSNQWKKEERIIKYVVLPLFILNIVALIINIITHVK